MNLSKLSTLLEAGSRGKIFSVEFVKKDGAVRRLNGRLSKFSRKGKVGGELRYIPQEFGLVPVFDIGLLNLGASHCDCYRMINHSEISRVNGIEV